jgi:hypothetical protein
MEWTRRRERGGRLASLPAFSGSMGSMASILGRASLESSTAPGDPGEGQGMIFLTGDDPIDSIKCSCYTERLYRMRI